MGRFTHIRHLPECRNCNKWSEIRISTSGRWDKKRQMLLLSALYRKVSAAMPKGKGLWQWRRSVFCSLLSPAFTRTRISCDWKGIATGGCKKREKMYPMLSRWSGRHRSSTEGTWALLSVHPASQEPAGLMAEETHGAPSIALISKIILSAGKAPGTLSFKSKAL